MSVVRIAQKAGVSIATVSRVLTKSRYVHPQTADKVHVAMEQLGLVEEQTRRRERRLGTGCDVRTIGVVTVGREYRKWFGDPMVSGMVAEITRVASERRIKVVLAEMPDPQTLCAVIEEKQVDGALLLIPSEIESTVSDLVSQTMPVVRVMGAQFGPTRFDHVTVDHAAIGYLAAKYLIDQGCRRLGFITRHADWPIALLRSHGFFSAVDAIRPAAPVEDARAYFISPPTPVENSYGGLCVSGADWPDVMRGFVQHRPDGVFVLRDAELSSVYRLLAEHNITPGKDITVVSCDNCDTWLGHMERRPATIDIDISQMAEAAVDCLIARALQPERPPSRILTTPHLVPCPTDLSI